MCPCGLPDGSIRPGQRLANGNTEVFFELLPDLIRLVCKGDSEAPFRMEAKFEDVKALLAA